MSRRYSKKGSDRRELLLSVRKKKNRGGQRLIAWRNKQLEDIKDRTSKNHTVNEIIYTPEMQNDEIDFNNDHEETSAPETISGKRIVDISYFLNELKTLNKHGPFGCTFSDMKITSEIRCGLISGFKFKCNMCNFVKVIWTEKRDDVMPSNTAAVVGIMKIGCGHTNMEEFFSTLNMPCMSVSTFLKEQDKVSEAWEKTAAREMEIAIQDEINLATERGDLDVEGIPLLTVVVDGTWAKRSYRTNYASLSGVAAIVGYETKKVLFLGVRNKYCCICARAYTKNIPAKNHRCFKNWSGSSSGMEADIIVEGFCSSISMHGVKFAKVIGDGDSNVYKKLLDANPYENIRIEKIECKNHLLRNACNRLQAICKDSKNKNVLLRQLIGKRILRIRTAVIMAANYRKNEASNSKQQNIANLRTDILNAPLHVFGNHNNCASYFCDKSKNDKDYTQEMRDSGLLYKVMDIINNLADHSKSLIFDANNNTVEQFNSIIAKFIGGKRVNYCLKRAYQTRCNAAVVAHNSKAPLEKLHKNAYGCSPGTYIKLSEKRKECQRLRNTSYERKKKKLPRKRLFESNTNDLSYGYNCQKPDMDDEAYENKKKDFLNKLSLNATERDKLMKDTVMQSESFIWIEERKKRLTASHFGHVCNKLPSTKCDNFIKKILYNNLETDGMKYGRRHEKDALRSLEGKMNIEIEPCGLIVDEKLPFLAATPDGLIGDDGIVEIKCPSSCSELSPEEAILSRKVKFWNVDKKTKTITHINKRHIYYFQIQGQLQISKRSYCLFALWTPKGLKTEEVKKDSLFWQNTMEQQLTNFYYDCLLPEILDPRYPRNLPIRNPDYIIEAQKLKGEKRKKN